VNVLSPAVLTVAAVYLAAFCSTSELELTSASVDLAELPYFSIISLKLLFISVVIVFY
jgi:hypothetical protein